MIGNEIERGEETQKPDPNHNTRNYTRLHLSRPLSYWIRYIVGPTCPFLRFRSFAISTGIDRAPDNCHHNLTLHRYAPF